LEVFGEAVPAGDKVKHHPFHSYTMKQAIKEGFILDVLENYTPVDSYFRLKKMIEDDPAFDVKKAQKKLRHYVESHSHTIREKTVIVSSSVRRSFRPATTSRCCTRCMWTSRCRALRPCKRFQG